MRLNIAPVDLRSQSTALMHVELILTNRPQLLKIIHSDGQLVNILPGNCNNIYEAETKKTGA